MFGDLFDSITEVLPRRATIEQHQAEAQLIVKVFNDLSLHIVLGGRRHTDDGRDRHVLLRSQLANKPGYVHVVRPEIVAPLG